MLDGARGALAWNLRVSSPTSLHLPLVPNEGTLLVKPAVKTENSVKLLSLLIANTTKLATRRSFIAPPDLLVSHGYSVRLIFPQDWNPTAMTVKLNGYLRGSWR